MTLGNGTGKRPPPTDAIFVRSHLRRDHLKRPKRVRSYFRRQKTRSPREPCARLLDLLALLREYDRASWAIVSEIRAVLEETGASTRGGNATDCKIAAE